MNKYKFILVICIPWALLSCTPKVKVEAPDKPIRIDMNVKIDHEVRVRVERDLEQVLSEDKGLF